LDEALRRAELYHDAGADAILIHSARSDAHEILAFMAEWSNRAPVVIVPTKYHATPTDVFRRAGCSTVIWANHLMRAGLAAMAATAREVFARESISAVEKQVASLSEVFRLQDAAELERAEARYLPTREPASRRARPLPAPVPAVRVPAYS
jgi:phosphoenolpyruvate phosphomutase